MDGRQECSFLPLNGSLLAIFALQWSALLTRCDNDNLWSLTWTRWKLPGLFRTAWWLVYLQHRMNLRNSSYKSNIPWSVHIGIYSSCMDGADVIFFSHIIFLGLTFSSLETGVFNTRDPWASKYYHDWNISYGKVRSICWCPRKYGVDIKANSPHPYFRAGGWI